MSSFSFQHIPLDPAETLASRGSAELEQAIADAILEKGSCRIGLSGGSTPKPIYEELGSLVSVEWDKVTIFLVDERYVPADDDESNQLLVRESLLANASIPESQVIFPDTSLSLEECIEDYDFRIDQLMSQGIDIVVLGMGGDGHIASLFPGDIDALTESEKLVLHTTTDAFAVHDRITVTLPVLQSAQKQFFFLKKDKKDIFGRVMAENMDHIEYPAHVVLEQGRSVWVTEW